MSPRSPLSCRKPALIMYPRDILERALRVRHELQEHELVVIGEPCDDLRLRVLDLPALGERHRKPQLRMQERLPLTMPSLGLSPKTMPSM